jgi:uncharacterized protein (DUF433 family)
MAKTTKARSLFDRMIWEKRYVTTGLKKEILSSLAAELAARRLASKSEADRVAEKAWAELEKSAYLHVIPVPGAPVEGLLDVYLESEAYYDKRLSNIARHLVSLLYRAEPVDKGFKHLVRIPGVRGGDPVLMGTRLTVEDIGPYLHRPDRLEYLRQLNPNITEEGLREVERFLRREQARGRGRAARDTDSG